MLLYGIWKHVQCCPCWKAGIMLMFFIGFGFCMNSSPSPNEVASSESNSDANNLNMSTFCSFRKYIMESYFENYESLRDSNFHEFIADELFDSCKLLPDKLNNFTRLSVPRRYLIGEGSHRHLSSTIRLRFQPESLPQLPTHFCKVIIIERLPSGVFADPFELQHLLQRGVFTDVAVFGDTNLELPSVLSNRTAVEIHMNVGANILFGHINELEISVDLPLHARYPPLDESGYSKVEFGGPDLFMRCNVQGNFSNQSCFFMPTVESKTGAVAWRIPCGIMAHTGLVSVVTFATAFVSVLSIVLTSLFYSDVKLCKFLKQD